MNGLGWTACLAVRAAAVTVQTRDWLIAAPGVLVVMMTMFSRPLIAWNKGDGELAQLMMGRCISPCDYLDVRRRAAVPVIPSQRKTLAAVQRTVGSHRQVPFWAIEGRPQWMGPVGKKKRALPLGALPSRLGADFSASSPDAWPDNTPCRRVCRCNNLWPVTYSWPQQGQPVMDVLSQTPVTRCRSSVARLVSNQKKKKYRSWIATSTGRPTTSPPPHHELLRPHPTLGGPPFHMRLKAPSLQRPKPPPLLS
jgi:hypothetical protein